MEKHVKIVPILIVSALLLSLFAPVGQAAERPMAGGAEREVPVGLEISVSEFDPHELAGLEISVSEFDQQRPVGLEISTRQPTTVTLTPESQEVTVGLTATLTATVLITGGVPVTDGTNVLFFTNEGTVVSPVTTTGGIAVTTLSGVTQTVTATVLAWAAAGVNDTAQVVFTPDEPASLDLTPDSQEVPVSQSATLTATVTDQYGNPVDPTQVNFLSNEGDVVSPVTTTGGIAVTTLSGVTQTVTATVLAWAPGYPGVNDTADVIFTSAEPASLVLTPESQEVTVGQSATLTATVTDEGGNPLDGIEVNFLSNEGDVVSPVTTTGGIAVTTLSGVTQTVTATVLAWAPGYPGVNDTAQVVFTPDEPASLDLTPDSQEVPVSQSATLTATVTDQYSNPVDPTQVNFLSNEGDVVSPVTTTGGIAVTTLSGVTQTVTATVLAWAPGHPGVNDTATVRFVTLAPVITIAKEVDTDPTYPGDVLTYTITLENQGTVDATGVTMEDSIPANTTYVDGSADATDGTASYIGPPADMIVWSGDIGGGSLVEITFQATVDSVASGTAITNTAYVSESHLAERGSAETVTTVSSRLDVEKTADPPGGSEVNPGSSIVYTIVLANVSGGDVPAADVTDTLDPNTSFVTGTVESEAGVIGYLSGDGDITWSGTVTQTITLTIEADVDGSMAVPQVITNTAVINDGQGSSFTEEVAHTVVSAIDAAKSVQTGQGDAWVYPGDTMTYTLVLNAASGTVPFVTVNDPIPANTTYVEGSVSGGVYQDGAIVWVGSVEAGSPVEITFQVQVADSVAAGTWITNVATINDGVSPEWTAEDLGVEVESPLSIAKVADPPAGSEVEAGDLITYTLSLANNNPAQVLTFSLTDDLDDNVEFAQLVSWTGSPTPTVADGQVTWSRQITKGDPLSVTFVVTTASAVANGTVVTNSLSVDDGAGSLLTASVTHTLASAAQYAVDKSASATEPDVNDEVIYTIVVENVGGDEGTFVFTDTIPAGTGYVTDTVSDNAEYVAAQDMISGTTTLAAGESVTFTFAVTIDAGTPYGTQITNTAWVSDLTQAVVESDSVVIIATNYPDLSTSTKEGTPDAVVPGGSITYTITLNNTGSGEGDTDSTLYDPIPSGTSWDGWVYQPSGAQYFPSGMLGLVQELGLPFPALQAGDGGFVFWQGKVGTTEPVTLSFRVAVDTEATLGQKITNTAYISDTRQDIERTDVAEVAGTALLTVTKSVDEPNPFAGTKVKYTVVLINGGDINLEATMTDDLAGGVLEYVTSTVTGGAVYTDSQILWTGQVTRGEEVTITYEATVPDTLEPGDMVTNTANVVYLEETTSDTAMLEVGGAPQISAWKRVWNGSAYTTTADAYPTSLITYTLTVSNSGTGDASVSLSDEVPAGMTYQSHGPGLRYTDYPIPKVYTTTTVISQSQQVFVYTVKVNDGQTAGEIPNQFSYSWDGSGDLLTDPVTVTVHSPLANSEKSVDQDTAHVGDTLLYTIQLNNEAPEQDVVATVTDIIPDYTSFITGSEGISYAGGQLTWSGTVTADQSVEITFTVEVASVVPQYPTEIVNSATVDDGLGNPAFDLPPVTTTVESKVGVTKTVDLDTAYPGSVLEYTIEVVPTDGSAELSDPIPANTTYVDDSVSGAAYDPVNDRIWLVTSNPTTVSFQVEVAKPLETPAEIVNTAYITDETGTMFTKEALTELTSPLAVDKSIEPAAEAGEVITWTISVTNQADYATTAVLTDVLPAGVEWISITQVVSDTGSAGYASGVLTWTGDVAAGALVEVSFPVTVEMGLADGTWIPNEAQINDGVGTILTASGGLTVSSNIDLASSSKSASESSPVPGEATIYTITLNNTGNMDATDITVTDTVPVNMTYVPDSASDGATWDGTTLTWSGVAVDAGGSKDLTFQATVNDGVAAGAEITNTAWISQSTLSAAVTTPPVVITVGGQAVLAATKSVEPAVAVAGETLTYTIEVTNNGNITTTEVGVTDPIPEDTTYVEGSVTGATYFGAADIIELTDATLGPGQSLTVTFAVMVDVSTTITNTAYVTGDGAEHEAIAVAPPTPPTVTWLIFMPIISKGY